MPPKDVRAILTNVEHAVETHSQEGSSEKLTEKYQCMEPINVLFTRCFSRRVLPVI